MKPEKQKNKNTFLDNESVGKSIDAKRDSFSVRISKQKE